jgi:hypothetical protein
VASSGSVEFSFFTNNTSPMLKEFEAKLFSSFNSETVRP